MMDTTKSRTLLSLALTVALLLQMLAPAWLLRPATAVAATQEPASVATAVTTPHTAPLAISRSQSSYASGDGLVVTYTIHNNLPPTQAPDVTPGQPLTDTLAALGSFDLLGDPNSLRQVILVFAPTEAAVVSASLPASLAGGVYTFQLDDIPPLGQASVTIELDGPGSVTEPTELDNGATGWGMVNGRSATAIAPPSILWPDSMGDWLSCTLDANCQDESVIAQAAQLGQSHETIFTFVRDLPFESYSGSLRGARGTLWSAAGNSVDQASLLIALLRASGVPARYRSGQLDNADIETLILSMFPAPLGVVGHLPQDNPFPLADPLQNQMLWDESRDHYWVEAFLPGLGWTDLDPAFADAQIGDRFVAAPAPAPLSELPASLRHSVNLRLKVEKYHPFTGLSHSYPLDYTFSAVELVGEPVTFGQMVNTQRQGGMVFANVFHTYTPYLMLADADALLEGEPFQETITNFPLGTEIVTGEWLEIELHHPDGAVEGYEREIYDAIGYDARINGGTISVGDGGRTDEPVVSELTLFTALFAPSFVPVEAVDGEFAAAATAVTDGQAAYERITQIIADDEVTPDEADDLIAAIQAISRMTRASQRLLLLQHAAAADFGARRLGDSFLMRPYYDAPRVHLMAWETDTISGAQEVNLDLRRNNIRALPFPGQSLRGWQGFNVAYGLAAMTLESDLLQRFSPDAPVKSVANILSAAQAQGIPLATISPANLDELAALTISDEAKARITADLLQNPSHFVIVPAAPVALGDEETVGWLRSDILSGETIDVSEDGLHMVAVEYAILISGNFQETAFAIAGFGQGFAGFTLAFLGEFLGGIPGDMKAAWDAALAAAEQWASQMAEQIAENIDHEWVDAYLNGVGVQGGGTASGGGLSFSFGEFDLRVGGFNNGAAFASAVIGSADPPLPPALAVRLPEQEFNRPAVGVVNVTGSGGTAVNTTLQLQSFSAQGTLHATWDHAAQSGLRFDQLTGQGELWVNGHSVGSGVVVANNGSLESSGAIAYQSIGAGGLGFYAPAVSSLGSGAFWRETAVTLTPATSAELSLRGATAVLNGQVYSGTMTLVTTSPVAIEASGPAAAPHFAAAASLTASDATLGLPPASGSLTIGGTAVSLQNGLSLPNFNGSISISEAGPDADQVTLNGDAYYVRLATDPAVSTTTPDSPVTFQATITANFSDAYTVTLATPGWAATVAPDGSLTVTPTLTTAPGDYTLLVTAQSGLYPAAVAAVEHIVSVTPIQGVELTIQPDPIYTIPFGQADGPEGATNNGQVQIPEAAYAVQIVNRSSQPYTFDVTVSGLTPGWLIFAGIEGQTATQVTLPAGGTTWLGLYVRPDTAELPAPGTSQSFAVTAVAQTNPAVTDSDSATFVMPSLPFQRLWVEPSLLLLPADAQADFTLHLRNLGNAAGSFDLAAALPDGWNLNGLQSPVALNAGQSASQNLTLDVGAGPLGSVHRVSLASPVPNQVYTQWATLNVRIVSANTAPIFAAALGCLADEQALAAALNALALAMADLEESCAEGCAAPLRDRVVVAAASAANYGRFLSPLGQTYTGLSAAAAHLAAQSDDADILAALPGITSAVSEMETELCAILAHQPAVRLTPWLDAALPGQTVNYNLQLTNRGSLATSYAVTVTLPNETQTFQQTIEPGATENRAVAAASADLGLHLIAAEVKALGTPLDYLIAQSEARLNVVDRFVQVTAVTADPPFVETGISSTTLQLEIANVAGIGLSGVVETAVFAPDGSPQWSDAIPLTIIGGAPRLYDLAVLDTSGWAAGVYTVTADVQLQSQPTAGGAGYGYFSVGQAVQLSQAVRPEIVAPGAVTVTTVITSEMNGQLPMVNGQSSMTMYDAPLTAADLAYLNPESSVGAGLVPALDGSVPDTPALVAGQGQPQGLPAQQADEVEQERPFTDEITQPLTPVYSDTDETHDDSQFTIHNSQITILSPAFTRTEQDDLAWTTTGTWTNVPLGRASGGSYWRNATAGSTAQLTFDGTWVSLGFIADRFSGYVEVSINGDSYGALDLYRREETAVSYLFDGLPNATHTLTLTVLGAANPFASSTRVQLDYTDYGDGSLLPDGSFEEDDPRLLTSGGWTSVAYAGASGGSYLRAGTGTAWFPFAGDSFTLYSIAHSNAGTAQLFVDGVYLDTIHMFAPVSPSVAFTRTFSYEGLGGGPHILQIISYLGQVNIDKLATPGTAPFIDPNPPVTGVTRFEADHHAIRYNGVPFTQTAASWVRVATTVANHVSAGEYIYSAAAGDTVSFDFEGEWLGIGFATERRGGQAEIAIDGQPVATVDLYSRYEDTASVHFRDLGAGPHTVTITVLGTSHPEADGTRVHLDFFDVWDGLPLAEGTFEEDDERVILSNGWSRTLNADASGGAFASSTGNVTAWFAFTGDSFTYHGRTRFSYQDVELRINGESLGQFDIYSYQDGFRTYSFDDLGAGPHVLEIRQYRNSVTLDAISSPAVGPAYEPPAPAAIVRYEENHPDMRYNGQPYHTMPQSWLLDGTAGWFGSGGHTVRSSTVGDVWSMAFSGEWVNIGLRSTVGGADIRLNGVSQGIFDTSGGVNGVKNFPFALDPGFHLVEVEVISGTIAVDYLDVWQGEMIDAGWYDAQLENEETGLFHFSNKQWWRQADDIYAYNGDFLTPFSSSNTNIWFTFVGTDLTLLGYQLNGTALHVVIDGVDYGEFDMSAVAPFRGQPFALHFPDLGEGAHVAQVFLPSTGNVTSRIDAFEVNPDGFYSYMPEIKWYDTTGTEDLNPAYGTGFLSTIAIGDLNGNGSVELVAPGVNGRLYVYRGDGADTGDGSPILWTSDLVGPAAEPALADLTGDGNAEIIISGENGTFAFTYDGDALWHNPDVVSFYTAEQIGWGGPGIGNLDLSPEPEIVIASSQDALYVLDHMGNIQWSVPLADRFVTPPVLADITGDGFMNIIVADKWDLRVYDYFNGGQLVWEYTQPDQIEQLGGAGAFGPPAVADITGDGQPEIIINWGVFVEALRADGSLLWKYDTGNNAHFRPSPITVADTTGDGQMNLVTASAIGGLLIFNHTLMVLDADGNLVWQQLVGDTTASASGVSAQDLTGNGVWEVLWNGSVDGFLVLRGSDGKRLFNEPYTASGTVLDYPTLGDVDGDGVADVVMAGRNGLFVVSHVGRWADSRPLWNQHNYHFTNINDDWSVPLNEPNSWQLHNTYRTQTPERSPAPAYQMVFTYTEGMPNVTVLTETASVPLTAVPPLYGWAYRQEWYQPVITTTFDSLLTGMQPGETRQVSAGTEVAYRLPSGFNYLTLPPLYVTAARLLDVAPAEQMAGLGSTAVFTLTLSNPGQSDDLYSLDVDGLPADWLSYPAQLNVLAQSSVAVALTVTIPAAAELTDQPFLITAVSASGNEDRASASLSLFNGLAMAIDPPEQTAQTGTAVAYTLTLTNSQLAMVTYQLSTSGLAQVEMPDEIEIAGETAVSFPITVTSGSHGPLPITISASGSGGSDTVDAVLLATGRYAVALALDPESHVAGPGAPAEFSLAVSNLGDIPDGYDLALELPAGWSGLVEANGAPLDQINLPPHLFNSADLRLRLTPDLAAAPGLYPFSATATSSSGPGVQAVISGTVEVLPLGVIVAITPAATSLSPLASGVWQVTITNTGSVAESYDLAAAGVIGLTAEFSSDTVTLNPGQSQTVQLSAGPLPLVLPQTYPFWVTATSQTNAQISNKTEAAITFTGYEGVELAWLPASQTVTNTLSATFLMIITNTGNVATTYDLGLQLPGLASLFGASEITLPAGATAVFPALVWAGAAGSYTLTAVAQSETAVGSAQAELVVILDQENQPPIVTAGPDQTVGVNQLVRFSGSAVDPDGDEIVSIEWNFGDGNTAEGTFTPTHRFAQRGEYTVTLTVTDSRGGASEGSLTVQVNELLFLPLVVNQAQSPPASETP